MTDQQPEPRGVRTGHGWPAPTGDEMPPPSGGPVTVISAGHGLTSGPAPTAMAPLTAAYCAERAAAAIGEAERAVSNHYDLRRWLAAARHWQGLAVALATHPAMSRPREPSNDRR